MIIDAKLNTHHKKKNPSDTGLVYNPISFIQIPDTIVPTKFRASMNPDLKCAYASSSAQTNPKHYSVSLLINRLKFGLHFVNEPQTL